VSDVPDAAHTALPPGALPLLRLLWPGEWALESLPAARHPEDEASDAKRPVLRLPADAPATLYLPPAVHNDWAASVAHAAAHRRFGGPPQPRKGLKPVQQALLGVLEDARIEWLACEELPGLRRWWLPPHSGEQVSQGQGFEDLLARLSASLLDADRVDPHPWIARVRQHFFEPDGHALALRTPEALREAASRLGHDIGQMRLPFNPSTYHVHARYRDDNSHLWLRSDEEREALTLPEWQNPPDTPPHEPIPPSPADWRLEQPVATYPEWDHRIGHYRPAWVQVHEHRWSAELVNRNVSAAAVQRLVRQSLRQQPALGRGPGRDHEGDQLHPQALVGHALARRSGQWTDTRIWCRPAPRRSTHAVLLLVDASVSTATDLPAWLRDVQQMAWALQRMGQLSAVWAFGSDGRHRVRLQGLKDWQQRCEVVPWGALQAGGSTRLGAALRHAAHLCRMVLARQRVESASVLLLTDGELHDIDVHDSAHLPADLLHAVRELRAQGLGVQALASGAAPALRRALGPGHCWPLTQAGSAAALARLLTGSRG
jgi:Mg-chelatase subunit ChlD